MVNKTQEALKMAIEVMEEGFGTLECEGMLPHRYQEAIQSCKEALVELQEHDNEVIERCAKVAESLMIPPTLEGAAIANKIRALKGKQNESALDVMAENARELGLVYCKHGSDSYCKECAMEEAK